VNEGNDTNGSGRGVLLGLAAAAIALLCCAGLPLAVAAIGGLTVSAVVGVGAGVAFLAVVATLLVLRSRRRHLGRRTR
jgi:Flp pilus assembly protein TadB